MSDFTAKINGYYVEYWEDEHLYMVDGVIVPSITQLLKLRYGKKYDGVNPMVLQRASDAGTAVHEAIEKYCRTGIEDDLPEVRNFKFLQKHYGFEVDATEVPLILFEHDEPIACGRCDLVLRMDGKTGLADIKRTSVLDKGYLAFQLNMYRVAFQQSYHIDIDFLKGIHLREDKRKFVDIPINEIIVQDIIKEYEGVKV